MQWGRVKNILIVILLAVNLFLLGNLGVRLWQSARYEAQLERDVAELLDACGLALGGDFRLPPDAVLPTLSLDRSRVDEERAAAGMLGGDAVRTEQEDGTVRFEGEDGTVEWSADGGVTADCATGEETPADGTEATALARRLLALWGFTAENASFSADGTTVTMTGTVAGLPVHNRALTLSFYGAGRASLSGLWSFGTPYTTVREGGTQCSAADALLEFAAHEPDCAEIRSVTAGYRMQTDSSRRTQLLPTWRIETDTGDYLVDCAKKTIVEQEK